MAQIQIQSALKASLILLIRCYRYIFSLLTGPCGCRFQPTCSQYAIEAIHLHGPLKGSGLMIRRLLHCHPWYPGGIDFVPASSKQEAGPVLLSTDKKLTS